MWSRGLFWLASIVYYIRILVFREKCVSGLHTSMILCMCNVEINNPQCSNLSLPDLFNEPVNAWVCKVVSKECALTKVCFSDSPVDHGEFQTGSEDEKEGQEPVNAKNRFARDRPQNAANKTDLFWTLQRRHWNNQSNPCNTNKFQ